MFNNTKFSLVIVLMILSLSTCETKQISLPIEDEALIKILSDVHVVEGALQNQSSSDKDSLAKVFYNQIYEKHDITEEDFVKTLEVLEKDPKLLGQIYDKVLIELDSLEERSYKKEYKKK